MSAEAPDRRILLNLDGEEVEVRVAAAHAEQVEELLQQAIASRTAWERQPEEEAARMVVAVDPDDPGMAFARVMAAYTERTGDREAPLNGVAGLMLSHGTMLPDLAMLLRWLRRQGAMTADAAEQLGLRPDALDELDRIVAGISHQAGPGDLSWELQVRSLMRQLQQQLAQVQTTRPDGSDGSEQLQRHILLQLASGAADTFADAARLAGSAG